MDMWLIFHMADRLRAARVLRVLRNISVAALFVLSVSPAQAYIDPTASNLFFQFLGPLAAVLLAAWTFAKEQILRLARSISAIFWRKR